MPRRPTGEVIERDRQSGRVFALRFRAYGKRHFITLGGSATGWTRGKAEAELRHVLADVERGLWIPDVAQTAHAPASPGFHEFASEWLAARRASCVRRRRRLQLALSTISCRSSIAVCRRSTSPRSTATALQSPRARRSAESINKTITRLGQILA